MSRPEVVELRRASWADMAQVWAWNNAPDVRRWSMQTDPIPRPDHERWFRARLADPRARLWIARVAEGDVGTVRIEGDASAATVSIALAAPARGRGLGRLALEAACRAFFDDCPHGTLDAWIAEGNEASVRCFERCGFERIRLELHGGRTFTKYRLHGGTRT